MELLSAVKGTGTGAAKWAYNSVANMVNLVNAPIDWGLRKAGVDFQFGSVPLAQTNRYEKSAGYALDVITLVNGVVTKIPFVAEKLGLAARVSSEVAESRAVREAAEAVKSSIKGTEAAVASAYKDAQILAESFPKDSPEYAALSRGHVLLRPEEGAVAPIKEPSITIQAPADLDPNRAFWTTVGGPLRPSRLVVNTKNVIGVDGMPVDNMRRVAVFATHGDPLGFVGPETAQTEKLLETEQAAKMSAEVIARENAARAPEDRIQYLLLSSCHQGDFVGTTTNAQRFQGALDEAMGAQGAGTDRVIVLAADHPGPLLHPPPLRPLLNTGVGPTYKNWIGLKGTYRPVRFIPAESQVSQPAWHTMLTPEKELMAAGAASAGYTIYRIFHEPPEVAPLFSATSSQSSPDGAGDSGFNHTHR